MFDFDSPTAQPADHIDWDNDREVDAYEATLDFNIEQRFADERTAGPRQFDL